MNFIGVDLSKKIITVCVMNEKLSVVARKTPYCNQPDQVVEFFGQFRPFKVVVEATASYLWFVELLEPLAEAFRHPHSPSGRRMEKSALRGVLFRHFQLLKASDHALTTVILIRSASHCIETPRVGCAGRLLRPTSLWVSGCPPRI